MTDKKYRKWDVVWVDLEPVKGSEMKKTRPCVIISPNAVNKILKIVTIAPLTSLVKGFPMRVKIIHNSKEGEVCIEQIRTVSKERIASKDKAPIKEGYRSIITQHLFEYFKDV